MLRRNSELTEKDEKRHSKVEDQGSVFDNNQDPPTKLDSGRGNTTSFGGSGYFNRGQDNITLPQNHMFDIEEDNEDQFEQHQHE